MASCPKCGKRRIGKDSMGRRRCPHCGITRGIQNMDRSGFFIAEAAETEAPREAEATPENHHVS